MLIFLIIILGLIVGSFLNATIHRLASGESIVSDRSRCVHCHHVLSGWDLIPLVSFALLKGRCRYCHEKISWQYPLVETFTAMIFLLAFLQLHLTAVFWWELIFLGILIIVGVFDYLHYLILDVVVFPALGLALLKNLTFDLLGHQSLLSFQSLIVSGILGAVVVSGFFAAQYFLSGGRWIGFGDVKFGLFLGMLLGLKASLIMLLLAYCLGAVTGLVLIALGRKQLGSKLPFGTFLSLSAIIILLYGNQLIGWYLHLLGL